MNKIDVSKCEFYCKKLQQIKQENEVLKQKLEKIKDVCDECSVCSQIKKILQIIESEE